MRMLVMMCDVMTEEYAMKIPQQGTPGDRFDPSDLRGCTRNVGLLVLLGLLKGI